jgi:uncharacterized protein
VYAAYKEADRSVSAFAAKAALQCPGGCGRCCESPFIEASPLECLPLAATLIPKAEEWLARLELHLRLNRTLPSSCPFYVSFGFGKGFCSVYDQRPLICRLYGFAAYIDDAGNDELDSCHYHTEHRTHLPSVDPDGTGAAKAPYYRSFQRRLRKLNSELSQPMGLAAAVYQALKLLVAQTEQSGAATNLQSTEGCPKARA